MKTSTKYLSKHSAEKYDPVPCMVQGSIVSHCKHQDCVFLHRFPVNYFERKSEKIRTRKDFTYFHMHISSTNTKWLLPVNPYRKKCPERNSSELFRQGWGEIKLVGRIPIKRDIFHREEISFKYIAFLKKGFEIGDAFSALEITECEEIEEVAYFNGSV